MRFLFFIFLILPISSFAVTAHGEVVKVCANTEVAVSKIKVVKLSASVDVSREQAEFERLGYIVERCRVHLKEYDIRGTALVLYEGAGRVSAIIYQDN